MLAVCPAAAAAAICDEIKISIFNRLYSFFVDLFKVNKKLDKDDTHCQRERDRENSHSSSMKRVPRAGSRGLIRFNFNLSLSFCAMENAVVFDLKVTVILFNVYVYKCIRYRNKTANGTQHNKAVVVALVYSS